MRFGSLVVSFICGILLCAVLGWAFIVGPGRLELERARAATDSALIENRNLRESVYQRQRTLEEARDLVTGSLSSINKIRAIFKLLRDSDLESGSDTSTRNSTPPVGTSLN